MLLDIICKYLEKYFDQSDDYITGCSVDYPYFKENYKMIPISLTSLTCVLLLKDLVKQKAQ